MKLRGGDDCLASAGLSNVSRVSGSVSELEISTKSSKDSCEHELELEDEAWSRRLRRRGMLL